MNETALLDRLALKGREYAFEPERLEGMFVDLCPDEAKRSAFLALTAGSIRLAHETNPLSWEVSTGRDGRDFTLTVGRLYCLNLRPDRVVVVVAVDSRMPATDIPHRIHAYAPTVEGVRFLELAPADLPTSWPEEPVSAHREAIRRCALSVKKTPYARFHSPAALEILRRNVQGPVPDPGYPAGPTPRLVAELTSRVRRTYKGWENFADRRFVEAEVAYKRKASAKARGLLASEPLRNLIERKSYGEIRERLVEVARSTNLLYLATPSTGDLALLHQADEASQPGLYDALFDLLHGEGESPDRLARFSSWADSAGLPNRWTLPTYLLFLCSPETDFFVKPEATTRFARLVGLEETFRGAPDASLYRTLLQVIGELKIAMSDLHPLDMIDMQSLAFVVADSAAESVIDDDLPPDPDVVDPEKLPPEPTPPPPVVASPNPEHPLEAIARESGLPLAELERWTAAIARKKQAILYGPPGTGKTFVAQQLARHLVGGGDGIVDLVQFHPAYAYEDFIQGIRPLTSNGHVTYELVAGRFMEFCKEAARRKGTSVLIVDEINRANLARVFGELMYLLEYRDQEVPLAGGRTLRVPANVRVLGTMNTADRSIALVDHALRRRFAFLHLAPQYDVLRHFHAERQTGFDPAGLIEQLRAVNRQIGDPHYEVGVSFFLGERMREQIEDVWRMEILPYLEEFFFDQPAKVEAFAWEKVRERILGA